MNENNEENIEDSHVHNELEIYGDTGITSLEGGKIPKFLIFTYILLPIWGIFSLYYFWNGSTGWFDRGYWHQLQIAANTTFPIENQNMMIDPASLEEEGPIPQLK